MSIKCLFDLKNPIHPLMIVTLFALVQACSSEGCSGVEAIPGGFPEESKIQNAVQVQIPKSGVDFISENFNDLIDMANPDGMVFDIPPSCEGSTKICCDTPDPECKIDFKTKGLSLKPLAPDSIGFSLEGELKTSSNKGAFLPVTTKVLGIDLNCDAAIDTTRTGKLDIDIQGKFQLAVDGSTNKTRVALKNVTMTNLDDHDLQLSGNAGCTIANWLKTFFIDTVIDEFSKALDSQVERQFCKTCTGDLPLEEECGPKAHSCTDGVCKRAGQCMQSLGFEGRLDVGELLVDLIENLDGKLDLYAVAGHYAEVKGDAVALGLEAGASLPVAGSHPCVPDVAPPGVVPIDRSPVFGAGENPASDYHMAVGIHRQLLDRAAWAFWQTGALCIELGGDTLGGLNSDLLALIVPSLGDLVRDWPVPVTIKLRPLESPSFELRKNVVEVDPLGRRTLINPLLNVHLNQLEIEFYAFVSDRFARLLTLTADVTLPIALDLDGTGKIQPLLGNLEDNITNIEVTNDALLKEDAGFTNALFGAALSLLLPSVSESLPGMDLPEFMGVKISPTSGGMTSVQDNSLLALFLEFQVSSKTPTSATIETQSTIDDLHVPPTGAFAVTGSRGTMDKPWVKIRVDAFDTRGNPLPPGSYEWQYRIGSGFWSRFHESVQLHISDPVFGWQGIHALQFRARLKGLPSSLDETPDRIDFVIDTVGPRVKTEDTRITAWDAVFPTEDLRFEYLLQGTPQSGTAPTWTAGESEIPNGANAVRVVDGAGNATILSLLPSKEEAAPGKGVSSAFCSVSGSGVGHTRDTSCPLFFALFAGFYMLIRRKGRAMAPSSLAAISVFFIAACAGPQGNSPPREDGGDPIEDEDSERRGQTENTPGSTGRFSDLAIQGTELYVSGYEEKFGDLVFGRVAEDNTVKWAFVDGVPDEPPTYPTSTYRRGIHSPGDDVGRYTSLVFSGDGRAMISHHDFTNGTLRFSMGEDGDNRAFRSHVVDGLENRITEKRLDSPYKERVGLFTSMAIDDLGMPIIAYMATGFPGDEGHYISELRVARATTASPASREDWRIERIDSAPISCRGMCPSTMVCLEVEPREPRPEDVGHCAKVVTSCSGYCPKGMACVEISGKPQCTPFATKPSETSFPEGTGLWPSLISLPEGGTAISYYDRREGDLKLALTQNEEWKTLILDEAGDVGAYSSTTVDTDGLLHISYQDVASSQLLYLTFDGKAPGEREIVDDGIRKGDVHPVGADTCILKSKHGIRIVYQDQKSINLLRATRTSPGTWKREEPRDGDFPKGFYGKIAADSRGAEWISHYVYDPNQAIPGHLEVIEGP